MSPNDACALAAVLVGATAQAITGIGFALVCAPLLTLALGGGDGVRLANLLNIIVNLAVLRREWRSADLKHSLALFIPGLASASVVGSLMGGVSPQMLSTGAGVLVLLAVIMLWAGYRIRSLTGRTGAVIAGLLGGAMNVIGGVSGPMIVSYAANADWPAKTLRPTLNACFLGINVVSVLVRGVPSIPWLVWVALTLAIACGSGIGGLFAHRLNDGLVRRAVLILAAAGALGAIVQGFR